MAPFCYHCPLGRTYPECAVACADDLEAAILREGPETVAAFIADPVLGASGGGRPVMLAPPFVTSEAQLLEMATTLDRVLYDSGL